MCDEGVAPGTLQLGMQNLLRAESWLGPGKGWRELILADEELDAKDRREPPAAAQRSAKALCNASAHRLADGGAARGFRALLDELACCVVRSTCRTPGLHPDAPSFQIVTTPNPAQGRGLYLLQSITV
jgi:hypothetical protein